MRLFTLVSPLLALLLSACATSAPKAIPSPAPVEQAVVVATPALVPATFAGRAWIVTDSQPILASLSAPLAAVPEAPPHNANLADTWADPVGPWIDAALTGVAQARLPEPNSAHTLMLVTVAMNDALVIAEAARAGGLEVSDHAVVAEVASRVITTLLPYSRTDGELAAWVGVWREEATPAGVGIGRELGARVATEVLAWAARDSSDRNPSFLPPTPAPGRWAGLPANHGWGSVTPVGLASLPAVPAPPAWNSEQMQSQLAAFGDVQQSLGDQQRELVSTWQGGPGSLSVTGLWLREARERAATAALIPAEAAGRYAALSVALHNTAIATWGAKYQYLVATPGEVKAIGGRGFVPAWDSSPPAYPSSYGAFAGAAGVVLIAAFPADAEALAAMSAQVAVVGLYGGETWPLGVEAGLELGRQVAAAILGEPAAALGR